MQTHSNAIGGERKVPAGRRTLPVFNPATGEQYASVPLSSVTEVNEAVAAAKAALPAWVVFGAALRRLALAEQHRDVPFQQVIEHGQVFALRQVDQPEIGGTVLQLVRRHAGGVLVEHHLIATAGQRTLENVTLQGSVGENRDSGGHGCCTRAWIRSSSWASW